MTHLKRILAKMLFLIQEVMDGHFESATLEIKEIRTLILQMEGGEKEMPRGKAYPMKGSGFKAKGKGPKSSPTFSNTKGGKLGHSHSSKKY